MALKLSSRCDSSQLLPRHITQSVASLWESLPVFAPYALLLLCSLMHLFLHVECTPIKTIEVMDITLSIGFIVLLVLLPGAFVVTTGLVCAI
ncbi:MAG: DUF2933 domain-containing protein [Leptolyngbya sp. SIO1D8]|nr:DUF2933 domain-containing protein [Leptolyngbya sp. SIO1D8]